jgi:hypothetical protein
MALIDVIKHNRRPEHGKACDAEEDGERVEGVEVAFVGGEVSKVSLSVLGDTEEGSNLSEGQRRYSLYARRYVRGIRHTSRARLGT